MSGAIIYLVIVAVWAVVLVPRWLRSHDAPAADTASGSDVVEQAHGRVLSRRTRGDVQTDLAEPSTPTSEPAPMAAPVDDVVDEPAPMSRSRHARSYEPVARAHRMAVRRRVVFGLLMAAVAATAVVAGYGMLPWWSVGAPALLMPLYVVHTRRVIVAEHGRRRRERHTRELAARRTVTEVDHGDVAEPISVRTYRAKKVASGMRVVDRGVVFDQHAAEPWQPQPVPLPTYLTAPAAPRAHQPTVSIDQYDDESVPVEEAAVYDIRRAVGG